MTTKRKAPSKAPVALTSDSSRLLAEANRTMDGLAGAMRRVGKEPEALFLWLQDFASRRIDTDAELEAAHFEVNAFCLQRSTQRLGNGLDQPTREIHAGEPFEFLAIRRSDVLEIQRLLREGLNSLRTTANWDFPSIRLGLHWNGGKGRPGPVLTTVIGDGKELFLVEVRLLLGDVRWQVRGCAEADCDHLFLSHRKAQNYCGRTCQNRAAQKAYRAAHPGELSAARRARYEEKVRAKHPKAKVARRPPDVARLARVSRC